MKKDKHDSKTCFRCRLHDLWKEVNSKNEPEFILMSMAEACGSILSQLDEKHKMFFMLAVLTICKEDENETKH